MMKEVYFSGNEDGLLSCTKFMRIRLSLQRNHKIGSKNDRLIVWLVSYAHLYLMLKLEWWSWLFFYARESRRKWVTFLAYFCDDGRPLNLMEATNHSYILEKNPFSWTEAAHVVFVEQPIRVGFSQAEDASNLIRTEYQVDSEICH